MEASNRYGDLDSIISQVFGEVEESELEADETEGNPVEGLDVADDVEEVVESADENDESEVESSDDETPESDEAESQDEADEDKGTDDVLSQLVTVKVNGREAQIPVAEAIKGYQMAASANKKFEEAAVLRKEAQEALEFRETFDNLWQSDPAKLLGHFVTVADDPNAIVEAVLLQAAATGKLNPAIAEALGITDETSQKLALQYQRERLEAERAQLEYQRQVASISEDDIPDEHGYTVNDYRVAIDEIVKMAGLQNAGPDDKRSIVEAVFQHGDQIGVSNPFLAYASWRDAQARQDVERSNRAKKAVAKVAPATKTSAALAPKGQVQHSPTVPSMGTSQDAASWALSEIERKYGAL
jgi:hypothetical protein